MTRIGVVTTRLDFFADAMFARARPSEDEPILSGFGAAVGERPGTSGPAS